MYYKYGGEEWDPNRTLDQCAYCDAQLTKKNRSKEDPWPTWLQRKLPHLDGHKSFHLTKSTDRARNLKPLGHLPFRRKVKKLCKTCNSGFGSRIQNAAKPVLFNLLSRDFTRIPNEHLRPLGIWAAMFAMSYEFADYRTKSISQRIRQEFARTNTVPDGFSIWLGRYSGVSYQLNQQHLNRMHCLSMGGGPAPKVGDRMWLVSSQTVTTLALGSVFLIVYSFEPFGHGPLNMPPPKPFVPSRGSRWQELMDIQTSGSDWLHDEAEPFDDEEVQSLAIEPLSSDREPDFDLRTNHPEIDHDFWRAWTDEPAWQ